MDNIYLVGFMGTGKTEVAKVLAGHLKRTAVDMDEAIVSREKMPIAEIFKVKGEPYFRKIEKELVREFSQKEGLVVACGGGAFVDTENIALLKGSGIVFCLTSRPETILRRTATFKDRPLLNVKDPRTRIEELLLKRAPGYAQAHHTVDADRLTVAETAEAILKILGHP